MTQPAQQPPAGPPPQPPAPPQGQAGQQPPPAAPHAPPAPPAQGQQPPAYPYGTQPPTPPQQPPAAPPVWPQPPAPGQPPVQPYQPYPTPPAPTGQQQPGQQQPNPGDDGQGDQGSYDLSRLPRGARDEIERLRGQVAQRDTQLRTTTVSQQAVPVAAQHGVNPQALLGSTAWQQAAAQLDPAAPDYAQRLAWTIQGIAQQNPWMVQQQGGTPPAPPAPPAPPPASGVDLAGAGGGGQPITEGQLAQMSPDDIAKAYADGKLKHLL